MNTCCNEWRIWPKFDGSDRMIGNSQERKTAPISGGNMKNARMKPGGGEFFEPKWGKNCLRAASKRNTSQAANIENQSPWELSGKR